MAISVAILGFSGDGKTTSTIINSDGSLPLDSNGMISFENNYSGMDPKSHIIINCDKKALPFSKAWSKENKNYIVTTELDDIKKVLSYANKTKEIKSIAIDTINSYITYKEFNERRKLTFDQWRDLALDVVELITLVNTELREDQVVYFMGHVELITDVDGNERKVLATSGKKLKKIFVEALFPIVLFTRVESIGEGNNKYYFETKGYRSSAKTPIGMFNNFLIPNSMKFVDNSIRNYYNI